MTSYRPEICRKSTPNHNPPIKSIKKRRARTRKRNPKMQHSGERQSAPMAPPELSGDSAAMRRFVEKACLADGRLSTHSTDPLYVALGTDPSARRVGSLMPDRGADVDECVRAVLGLAVDDRWFGFRFPDDSVVVQAGHVTSLLILRLDSSGLDIFSLAAEHPYGN